MTAPPSRWWAIGGSLALGLFVAYLDRTNLSVAIPAVSRDLGFAGAGFAVAASWALTTFLIGYGLANILGGIWTARYDPKNVVIWTFAIWSLATLVAAFTRSLALLLACRFVLGVAEGIYWPQQSRIARAWFAPEERTRANALVQYYGQYLALALGFLVLTPIYDSWGWRTLFILTGAAGLAGIVPLYWRQLKPQSEAPYRSEETGRGKLSLAALGGPSFLLLVFSYVTQAMFFWGVTLWIPQAVRSIGYSGLAQGLASAAPYLAAVLLAVVMAKISDRSGKRVLIAALGLLIPGVLMLLLPLTADGATRLALITLALGLYASSYSPNLWSVVQTTVAPDAVGAASGITNGLGAYGGVLAGFLVGWMAEVTGSYMSGFVALGGLVIAGGLALLAYGRTAANP
jgi:MFS family permease